MIFSNFTGRVAKKAKVIDGVNGQFLSFTFASTEQEWFKCEGSLTWYS